MFWLIDRVLCLLERLTGYALAFEPRLHLERIEDE
jgi:hypothetical protein